MGIPEEELKPLVNAWRNSNPNITKFWWAVDRATKYTVSTKRQYECYGLKFNYEKGILFIQLPSDRRLAYVRPRMGVNNYGSECVTYEGLGGTKNGNVSRVTVPSSWRTSCRRLRGTSSPGQSSGSGIRGYRITMHVHDEVVLEVQSGESSVEEVSRIMGETPEWADDLCLRADGYECEFYRKE